MLARNILVSAMITSWPFPAKTMLAEVVPRKNLPRRVPEGLHTCREGKRSNDRSNDENWTRKHSGNIADLHTIPTPREHVAIGVNLDAVWHASIDIGKNAAILKCVRNGVDVERVAVCKMTSGERK